MALEQYSFGAGKIYMVPQNVAVPMPVQVGTNQDCSFDMDWAEKPLQGRLDAAAAIARGALKVTGKIKAAKFSIADISRVIFGTTPATGTILTVDNEGGSTGTAIPAAVVLSTSALTSSGATLPFTSTTGVANGQAVSGSNIPAGTTVASFVANTSVTLSQAISGAVASGTAITFGSPTITAVNASTFIDDLGVIYASTGVQLTRVASSPATGQYAVSAGVYTFAAADSGLFVTLSYSYSQSTAGKSFTYIAQPMGFRPVFKLVLSNAAFMNNPAYAGQPLSAVIWSAGISKFSLDFKNEDWTIPESDFSASQAFQTKNVVTFGADQ